MCIFIPRHFKCAGYCVIPSIQKKRSSVRPSVCLYVRQRIVFTLLGAFFNQFLQTCYES